MEINITGKILTSSTEDERNTIYKNLATKMAESAQNKIHEGLNRSIQLMAMVGQLADQEAVRALIRGLKVKVISFFPQLQLEAVFQDELNHWYGGGTLPEDIAVALQEIIDTSLSGWINSEKPSEVLAEVLNS